MFGLSACRTAKTTPNASKTGLDADTLLKRQLNSYWGQLARAGKWRELLGAVSWYVRHQGGPPPIGFRTQLRRWLGRGKQSVGGIGGRQRAS